MASIPEYTTIIVTTLNEIDLLLHNYVYDGYAAISSYLRIPLGIVATIYLVIFGYSIAMGWVKISMGNFVKAVLKIALIYMAVTQWAWVSEYFVGLINNLIGGLGDALISASPVHIPGVDGIDGAMQITLIQFTKLGSTIFSGGGLSNFGAYLEGMVVWGFGYALVGVGLFEIVLSKVMLAVLFVFTPLITILCFFKPLQGTFDRWLGAIVGFALLQLFVTATLALGLSLSYWWLAAHQISSAAYIGNKGTLPIIIIGIICLGFVLKAAQLAQNLGGVVSTSAASAMVGGMIGGFMGSTMGGMGLVKSAVKVGAGAGVHGTGLASGILNGTADLGANTLKAGSSAARSVMNGVRSVLRRGGDDS